MFWLLGQQVHRVCHEGEDAEGCQQHHESARHTHAATRFGDIFDKSYPEKFDDGKCDQDPSLLLGERHRWIVRPPEPS